MTDRELLEQALEVLEQHVEHYDYEQFTSVCELDPAKDIIAALRERLAQPQQWEQFYPDIGNPFKRPATREEKIVNPGVYTVQEQAVMRERSCAECGKSGGWALYCVACAEKLFKEPT